MSYQDEDYENSEEFKRNQKLIEEGTRRIANAAWAKDPEAYFEKKRKLETCSICGHRELSFDCSHCGHRKERNV